MNTKTVLIGVGAVAAAAVIGVGGVWAYRNHVRQAEEAAVRTVATTYTQAFAKRQYRKLATVVDTGQLKGPDYQYTKKTMIARNQAVFDRVGASDIKIQKLAVKKLTKTEYSMRFNAKMTTKLGPLTVTDYTTTIRKVKGQWRVRWLPAMLFPQMSGTATVQLTHTTPTRGELLDRNGSPLAANGTAKEAGMVRGQLGTGQTLTDNLTQISAAFSVPVSTLQQLLAQGWVTDENFVPIKTVTATPTLTGVTYQTVSQRTYPLGEAAAQLTGYVGEVSADDLKQHPTLQAGDQIGKAGLERAYNTQLAGKAGGSLTIVDQNKVVSTLIARKKQDGKTIRLTIDADKQAKAYAALAGQKGAVVTLAPKTGQLLTLVSAPSYDPNKFVAGISQADYDAYANSQDTPFTSRFLQRYAPGSTFKMITAGVALDNGTITPTTTRTIAGLKWQKASSWGDYYVTRLHEAASETMAQALAHSDNIWFAQTALKMGSTAYLKGVTPFLTQKSALPLTQPAAQLSNTGKLASDILLADTAYGQGQLLMTPLQQATAYTALVNDGNMQLPTLRLDQSAKTTQVLKATSAAAVKAALLTVVSASDGTAHGLASLNHQIAAKTGTAELKTKQNTAGETNGFLMAEDAEADSYLMLALVEGVQGTDVVTTMTPYLSSLY
ncbi:penicillin-binding protein PBP4(5) [Lacticaseibacillus daqingensis]|uniref:penicillin-binding protein PBP4(5) n=1 Tax=Lacticaseibacillus daqingensis TaxID=2486014 RepID=UPI000F78F9E1|nr:penicillin-binding transpeptidase domain-containing protein [Lacticaseibacillus daqingensis]